MNNSKNEFGSIENKDYQCEILRSMTSLCVVRFSIGGEIDKSGDCSSKHDFVIEGAFMSHPNSISIPFAVRRSVDWA